MKELRFQSLNARRRRPAARRPASARPARPLGFELLEDRRLLTAVSWIGPAAGNWDVAANWSNHAVPTSTADVTINTATAATITIKAGDVESVHSLTLGGKDTLSMVGGSLSTVSGVSNSGTIAVAAGCDLTVGGAYSQAAGASLSMPGGGLAGNSPTNLATNSDFESPVATNSTTAPGSWGVWGTAYLSTQYAYTGSQSLQVSGPNSGVVESFAATPGASYTLSADAMMPASNPLTGNEVGQMELLFFNSSGTLLSSYSAPNSINVLTSSSATAGPLAGSVGNQGWNHFLTTAVAPSGTATAEAIVTTQTNSGSGGGSVFWDDVQFTTAAVGPSELTAGSISNSGTITVGPNNTVSTGGTFAQTSTGTLDIQLGGAPSSGAFGLVNVTGAATLAGTLKSDLVYGYTPSTTDSFTPIEFARQSGTFSSYSFPSTSTYQFAAAVTFTNVVIGAVPATAVTSTINANGATGAVASNFLGVNLGAYWDGQQTTTQTQQMATAAGLQLYRFPGGSASDDFHFNVSNNYSDSTAVTIPQFVQFISAVGGVGMVTVDYGSGSPQEAAAELAYLQGSSSDTTSLGTGLEWNDSTSQWQSVNWGTVGYWASLRSASPLATNDGLNFLRIDHPVPFSDIKYWEIGNEQYASWEVDHHGTAGPGGASTGAAHDPATYAAFAQQFAALATEITGTAGLPAISIGIDSGDPTGASDNNWTKNVLAAGLSMGFVPGFISDHSYMQAPGNENDSFLLNDTVSDAGSILDWSTRYADYESLLQQTLSSQASSVSVMATEFNSVSGNPGKQSTSLVNGLFIANSIGSLLGSGYQAGLVWDLRNGWQTGHNDSNQLYGWREGGDFGQLGDPSTTSAPSTGAYIGYPGYYALQLTSKIAAAGGEVVPATSNYGDLDVYAVKESNGHLDLLVINTNPAASLTDQFNVTGFQANGAAQVWQYGETQDTAQSHSTNGASALANSTATLNMSGSSFSYTFSAYSMTVLDLAPGPVVTPSGTHANYTLDGSAVAVDPGVTVASSDTDLSGATVTISAGTLQSGDTLSFTSPVGSGISGSYSGGVLTLSGSATIAQYQAALQSVAFSTTSTSTTTRAISIVAIDGALDGNTAPEQVNIAAAHIGLTGGGHSIADGSTATSATNDTAFGSTSVGGSAISETYTITNSGTAALTLGTVTIGGTNAGDFKVTRQPGSSVAVGGGTTFSVQFAATASGTRTATVSFTENDPTAGSPFKFAISGTATAQTHRAASNTSTVALALGVQETGSSTSLTAGSSQATTAKTTTAQTNVVANVAPASTASAAPANTSSTALASTATPIAASSWAASQAAKTQATDEALADFDLAGPWV